MRLLIITQKIDRNDTTLGFFHGWVKEIAGVCECVSVICLQKGEYDLPKNVSVYSLGKESGGNKLSYILRFFRTLFSLRNSYDKVFVHMNQEYVILAGLYWRVLGRSVFMWRNHSYGNFWTRIAIILSTKVFCTSKGSFTARFKKTVIMPVGVDTTVFKPVLGVQRKKYSVCMVGRVAPVKGLDKALEAVNFLIKSGNQVSFSVVGSVLPENFSYLESIKKYVADQGINSYVKFFPAISPDKLPEVYSDNEICLNLTSDGSFDKTIIESSACGSIPLVASSSISGDLPESCRILGGEIVDIAKALERLLSAHEQISIQKDLQKFVEKHSLDRLIEKLHQEMIVQ